MSQKYEFGAAFTDHMITADWSLDQGWHDLQMGPRREIPMDPGMVGLHYGQVVFEGLKAHRGVDDSIALFRPAEHALRFQRSARRMSMPELPVEIFVRACEALTAADADQLPHDESLSLYLRPVLYASEAHLALRPAREYRFLLIAFVTQRFFAAQLNALTVWVSREYSRAMPGGTGGVKIAGNYAPTYLVQQLAAEQGCDQVVWTDSAEHKWVHELGGMNLFFVRGSGADAQVVTPPTSDVVLPGITRSALLALAEKHGWRTSEEEISVDQWRRECAEGIITEVFACGTAAVVSPVGRVRDGEGDFDINGGQVGPVTDALHKELVAIQQGRAADPDGWRHVVPPNATL
ncbi:branched-chain amino acid aminotransferase [Skermania sp. ID1734]|uniref:branched-chain amino acid aminotransferase n=1 Tax=Skermania sp. ID1734 TaxID=2597516 RepID=UPI00117F45BC|nr:branched-chain amino acid aminotransferase [Skermania sp. ID1734]TSD97283.1 branched-chain amino acid aminotransferase [Skermania sp. ID1734]